MKPRTSTARTVPVPPGTPPAPGGMVHRAALAGGYPRFLLLSFLVNTRSAMAYKANFFLQVFGMALNNATFALFWKVLLDRTGPLGGYGFTDIMYLWAFTGTTFGLLHVAFGNVRSIARMVKEGDLDAYLLQPRDVLVNILVSRTIVSGWGDAIYGYLLLVLLGCPFTTILVFTLLVLAGILVMGSALVMAESLAFWLKGADGLGGTMMELILNFGLYPDSIFPPSMGWIFWTLVPTGFVVIIPRKLLQSPELLPALLLCAASLVWPLMAWLLFRAGLGRYASGNKVGARI